MIEPVPTTRRDDIVDDYHGIEVPDPYRWLEDGESPEVADWVAAQNRRTRAALDGLPGRNRWREQLLRLFELPMVLGVQLRGDRLVVLERPRGAEQARLVVRAVDGKGDDPPVVIADPAAGTDDAAAAVDWFEASGDGTLVAYGVSEGGSENSVLHVASTLDGTDLDEAIPNCRACSVAWDADGAGFHYTRYPDGDQYHRTVHHHRIGSDWRDDPVVWADHVTPETWPSVAASPCGRYLLVTAMVGWSRTDVHLLDRRTGDWTEVVKGSEAVTSLRFAGDRLIGSTTLDAPRGRVISASLDDPSAWITVVPERSGVIGAFEMLGDEFVVRVSVGAIDSIERWACDGSSHVVLDGVGTSQVLQLATDPDGGTAIALVTGFDRPPGLYVIREADLASVDADDESGEVPDLAVTRTEYASADGTMIGLFLVHRRDVEPGPDTPAILKGYGGFAIAEAPVWNPKIAAWCEQGGLYAIAGLRGGFEHGEAWHSDGKRGRKQNVFDDFHAAADHLVASGLASRDRLAIAGGSNGGLLVGAALTQRPDLCRAVWCAVPLLDMIRFPNFLIARLWTDEYGDPDIAEEFGWLWGYSPYHHVVDGRRYPAVLLTTAEGDSRVDPLHARKMAAMLQHAGADQEERPVLLHQEARAGHGVGKPVGKRADEYADVLAFLDWQLGGAS